jgi:hypothetical protein
MEGPQKEGSCWEKITGVKRRAKIKIYRVTLKIAFGGGGALFLPYQSRKSCTPLKNREQHSLVYC